MTRWSRFTAAVPGKWVLAGEHAVLRAATAVALPHPEFKLELKFEPGAADGLAVEPAEYATVIREMVDSVAESVGDEGRRFSRPSGKITIQSSIPVGAGLGSSAALCVALARWLAEPLGLAERELFEFAKQLEHRFHGRSSGMDISAVSSSGPIAFSMENGPRPLAVSKLPKFTFHDSGLRSRTNECVFRVERFGEENRFEAMKIDESMSAASRACIDGLACYDAGDKTGGLVKLAAGMKKAQECFYSWGLVPGAAKRLEEDLYAQGALAVKLTGAGGGGFLVALIE